MESDSLSTIKSTIKALIISAPNNVSVEQLNRDYKENIGENIPYLKMGYQSLEAFLQSMTDTVQICRIGNMAIVKNISNAKTSHIEQFVRDQRKNNRRGKNRRNFQRHVKQTPIVHSQQSYRNVANPYLPNAYYQNLNLIIASSYAHANTIGMQQYNSGRNNNFLYVNHQQGNYNLQLTSQVSQWRQQAHCQLTKTDNIAKGLQQSRKIQFQRKGNCEKKQQSQSKSKDFCKKATFQTLPPPAPVLPLPKITNQMRHGSIFKSEKTEQMRRVSIDESHKTEQTHRESIIKSQKTLLLESINDSQKTEQTRRQSINKSKITEQLLWESINESQNNEQTRREAIIAAQKTEKLPSESTIKSQKTKQMRQESIIESQTTEQTHRESIIKPQKTEPMHGESIIEGQKTEQRDRESINESEKTSEMRRKLMIESIKNVFLNTTKPHELKENDGKAQDKRTNSLPSSSSAFQSQQTQQVPMCQTVASETCDGRNDKENTVHKINLSFKNLTLKSTLTKDMNESLPSIVEILDTPPTNPSLKIEKPLKRTNDKKKHPLKESQHENILNGGNEYDDFGDAVPSFALTAQVFQIDYPEDVAPFGMNFILRELPNINSIIALYITKIVSPDEFYYHIGNGIEDFEYLSSDIQCFYETLSVKEYKFPPHCIKEGQICAASINGTWNRAIIHASLNLKQDYVKVYLVDSGYEVVLRQHEIKFLLRYFADFPIRVLKGRLSNLKPKQHDGKWSSQAVQRFQNLTFDRILYGKVMDVDKQENRLNIVLCDTNGSTQKNINMLLIKEGHAVKRIQRPFF